MFLIRCLSLFNGAIISLTEYIRGLIDKGEYVCGIFVDLEKAFDTVHHDILCDKIKAYGLRGNINKLLKSYLSNRKQYVSINGHDSVVKDVTCGVPQGSSLGPLLLDRRPKVVRSYEIGSVNS